MISFLEFINESQTTSGENFEELIGGILKDTKIIKDVKFVDGKLTITPNGKVEKIDTSLIIGLLQDPANVKKLKKQYSNIKSIHFNNISIGIE